MNTSTLTLYNYFRSSTSFRVRIALELKTLDYIYKPIHLLNNGGEQNSESYRKLNPMGGVPTLVHEINGETRVLGQSIVIAEYLDQTFPTHFQLLPENVFEKCLIKQFCEMINADIHSYGNLKTLQYLEKNFAATDEQKNQWTQTWFGEGLKACEKVAQQYSSGAYCFGDNPTLAEIFLIPLMVTAQRFKVPLEPYKKLNSVFNLCLQQQAFKKAHPFRQIDTPDELRLKD